MIDERCNDMIDGRCDDMIDKRCNDDRSYMKHENHMKYQIDEKLENHSHENGKMESYEHDKIENNERPGKSKDIVELKWQGKSHQKCRNYDRSDEKQRKNSPCEIHKTGPRKHKNRSSKMCTKWRDIEVIALLRRFASIMYIRNV